MKPALFLPAIEEYDLENMWLQQDGATCHSTRANMCFSARDISWPHNFSSWRYQLTTKIMQFDTIRLFLWGYAKVRAYAEKPLILVHLKHNIRQVMAEIQPNICQKVVENYIHNWPLQAISQDY